MPKNYLKKYLQCFWDEDLFPEQSNNNFGTRAIIMGRGRFFWDEDNVLEPD